MRNRFAGIITAFLLVAAGLVAAGGVATPANASPVASVVQVAHASPVAKHHKDTQWGGKTAHRDTQWGGKLAAQHRHWHPTLQSASAYTKVTRLSGGANGSRIMVKCHTTQDWRTLNVGESSNRMCGQNGWVDSIWNPDKGSLYAQNLNTGKETAYGVHYKGPIGGGEYYVYLLCFPIEVC